MEEVYNIAELFARDPRTHTKEDRAKLIAELREQRSKFVAGGRTAVAKPKGKAGAIAKLDLDIKI